MRRREFLSAASAFAALPSVAAGRRRMRIGFQVFGVRDMCARDFAGTLKTAKAMGYEGFETGRFYGRGAAELKALADDAGLELFALQLYPHNLTEPQLRETIRFCHAAGCDRICAAWYKGSEANPNDWQLLVNVMNHAADVCAKEGIAVAYHNHDHEFSMKAGGKTVWEWLWDKDGGDTLRQVTATPRFLPQVQQELDCGQCVLGGGDPVEWLDRFPGRNPTVHIMPAIRDAKGLRPGGAGVGSARDEADWPSIIRALRRNGTEWLTVKPTAFPSSPDDMAASIAYLRGLV